eukprot:gene112-147_t
MHKYKLLSKKGEGTFSEVLKSQSIKTGRYVAIKCMKNRFESIDQMDLFAAGCVWFEVMALFPLFPGQNEMDQLQKIHSILGTPSEETLRKFKLNSDVAFPEKKGTGIDHLIPHASLEVLSVLKKLLRYDPEERITARHGLLSAYFEEAPERTASGVGEGGSGSHAEKGAEKSFGSSFAGSHEGGESGAGAGGRSGNGDGGGGGNNASGNSTGNTASNAAANAGNGRGGHGQSHGANSHGNSYHGSNFEGTTSKASHGPTSKTSSTFYTGHSQSHAHGHHDDGSNVSGARGGGGGGNEGKTNLPPIHQNRAKNVKPFKFKKNFGLHSTITSGFGPAHIYNTNNTGNLNSAYMSGMNATMHKNKFMKKSNVR